MILKAKPKFTRIIFSIIFLFIQQQVRGSAKNVSWRVKAMEEKISIFHWMIMSFRFLCISIWWSLGCLSFKCILGWMLKSHWIGSTSSTTIVCISVIEIHIYFSHLTKRITILYQNYCVYENNSSSPLADTVEIHVLVSYIYQIFEVINSKQQ